MEYHDTSLRRQRHAWLAGICLLHAAALLAWRHGLVVAPSAPRQESEMVYLHQPAPAKAQPAAVAPPRAAARVTPPPPLASTAAAPAAAATPPPAPQAVTVPASAADPFAQPAPLAPNTLERARLAAAGVDRQLRKESLNKYAVYVEDETRLGRAIARSQTKDWVLEQTSDRGDGVVMKRYRRGNEEKCEFVNLVGANGQDPFRDGNKTRTMTCP